MFYTFISKKHSGILLSESEFQKMKQGDIEQYSFKISETLMDAHNYISDNFPREISKYYAVRNGRINGIFFSWKDCQSQVDGYPAAVYKSFLTINDAVDFMDVESDKNPDKQLSSKNTNALQCPASNKPYAYVDGSFNAATKIYGYGVILVIGGDEHVFSGSNNDREMISMRNVSGEIEGAMRAVSEAIKLRLPEITIYYDYMGIQMWAEGSWKRNKSGTIAYYNFIQEAKKKINIRFVKVKAHSNVAMNERVDVLAKKAVGVL